MKVYKTVLKPQTKQRDKIEAEKHVDDRVIQRAGKMSLSHLNKLRSELLGSTTLPTETRPLDALAADKENDAMQTINGVQSANREHLKQMCEEKTSKWSNTVLAKQKEVMERRYKKFEQEELARQEVERQEDEFVAKNNKKTVQLANEKLFEEQDRIKALKSRLLEAEVLQERKMQIEFRKTVHEVEAEWERDMERQTQAIGEKEAQATREKEAKARQLLEDQRSCLMNQKKDADRKRAKQHTEEKLEGKITKKRAEQALVQERIDQIDRKNKAEAFKRDVNAANEELKQHKLTQEGKEAEEQRLLAIYSQEKEATLNKRKEEADQARETKQRHRMKVIDDRCRELEATQSAKTRHIDKAVEDFEAKISAQEVHLKQKREEDRRRSQGMFQEQARQAEAAKKEAMTAQFKASSDFQSYWVTKNNQLDSDGNGEMQKKRALQKEVEDFNKMLVDKKNARRMDDILRDFQEAEDIANQQANENLRYHSYAEKCLKEWDASGKTVIPIIAELKKHRNDIVKGG
jgi:hypothetical protein